MGVDRDKEQNIVIKEGVGPAPNQYRGVSNKREIEQEKFIKKGIASINEKYEPEISKLHKQIEEIVCCDF